MTVGFLYGAGTEIRISVSPWQVPQQKVSPGSKTKVSSAYAENQEIGV